MRYHNEHPGNGVEWNELAGLKTGIEKMLALIVPIIDSNSSSTITKQSAVILLCANQNLSPK